MLMGYEVTTCDRLVAVISNVDPWKANIRLDFRRHDVPKLGITMRMHLLRLIVTWLVLTLPLPLQSAERDIVGEFEAHVAAKRWNEALVTIEAILKQGPVNAANLRDYGICLDEVGRHREAARIFLWAYSLHPNDSAAQYMVFRSYALGGDKEGFISFAKSESRKKPETLDRLSRMEEFESITASSAFRRLLKNGAKALIVSDEDIYRLVITSGDLMCQLRSPPSKAISEFVAGYERRIGKPLRKVRRLVGLHGEDDTCFPLSELDQSMQEEFIREATALYSGGCGRIRVDERCSSGLIIDDSEPD